MIEKQQKLKATRYLRQRFGLNRALLSRSMPLGTNMPWTMTNRFLIRIKVSKVLWSVQQTYYNMVASQTCIEHNSISKISRGHKTYVLEYKVFTGAQQLSFDAVAIFKI